MSDRETAANTSDHERAAEAFVSRVREQFDDELEALFVFGSTARGDATTLASDVDVLVVLGDGIETRDVDKQLHDLAYDVMLEYGPVVELHVLSIHEFESLRERGNPFVQNVVSEGQTYG